MPLPEPYLDDLRFQKDLVDEARRRIIRYCPEWTDYNLSDPGITLIELFAWMTEMMVYRLNRVPDKNYIKFLEMLGFNARPASSARTELTFWLSTPFPINPGDLTTAVIPKATEVATRRSEEEEEVIFTTDERFEITPTALTQIRRDQDFQKNYLQRMGVETFYCFGEGEIEVGDTFYLGFDETKDIRGHIMQLYIECEPTQATGIKRDDPPLIWECYTDEGVWKQVKVSDREDEQDTTGGLNNPEGALVLYLPTNIRSVSLRGRNAYWIRCRFEPRDEAQGYYTESPRILTITPYTLGGTVKSTHALIVENEVLGTSNGEPNQIFYLANRPVLNLAESESLEIEEDAYGLISHLPWTAVSDFSSSDHFERNFSLNMDTGEIRLGPAIRKPDGTINQYGRIPEAGREVRFSRYRYGGGTVGNVPIEKLEVLKSSIAYIDRTSNLKRAEGGLDPESLDEAKMRAKRELQTQNRAVTASDYEILSLRADLPVARVKCLSPDQITDGAIPGLVDLLVVPVAYQALAVGDLSKLQLDEGLQKELADYLDQFRLLTTTLRIREPNYLGIKVRAEIVVSEYAQPEVVLGAVRMAINNHLSPLKLTDDDESGEGWPFGGDLYFSDLDALVRQVPGVKHVWELEVGHRPVTPSQERPSDEVDADGEEEAVTPVEGRRLEIPEDTLLVSLDPDIEVVEK